MTLRIFSGLVVFFLNSIITDNAFSQSLFMEYSVNLKSKDLDSFQVSLRVDNIKSDSVIFQFAATTPGIYSVLDAGRFTGSFFAYDSLNRPLALRKINTNQFVIYNSNRLYRLNYKIAENYDTKTQTNKFGIGCAGSNYDSNNALINGFWLFGYFHGYKNNSVTISFEIPDEWQITGTLNKIGSKKYKASSYDELADSPFMMGRMTMEQFKINESVFEVSCYSQNDFINARQIANLIKQPITETISYSGQVPEKKYVFMYQFFSDPTIMSCALEHRFSSVYFFQEDSLNNLKKDLILTAIHEYFHTLIPIKIHSEIIQNFDYEKPTASRHLWFYEGVTQWAERLISLKKGYDSEEDFIASFVGNLITYDKFADQNLSLEDLSLGCYGEHGSQMFTAYIKGSTVALLMDIVLLDKSNGTYGLRDLILELSKEYHWNKSFSEKDFYKEIVKRTHPEIDTIINKYIMKNDPISYQLYFDKIGYNYIQNYHTGQYENYVRKWILIPVGDDVVIQNPDLSDSLVRAFGIQAGDILKGCIYNNEKINFGDNNRWMAAMQSLTAGSPFTWIVERDGKELHLSATVGRREIIEPHKFIKKDTLTKRQKDMRNWWLRKY